MTQIDPLHYAPELSPEQAWNIVNTMSTSYLDFSIHSNLYNRAFGVITEASEGHRLSDFTINNCMRNAIHRTLRSVQSETELMMGYNFSSRYHYEERPFPKNGVLKTRWPGIERMNVRPHWESIPNYGPFPVPPFVEEDVLVTPGTPPVVTFSIDKSPNPNEVYLRRNSDNGAMVSVPQGKYPRRVSNNTEWEVALSNEISFDTQTDTLNVQNRHWIIMDVENPDPEDVPDGATLYPVYPGTNQIIPTVRPPEAIDGNTTRYIFYNYTLIDPSFYTSDPAANLASGEFYKLLPEIEIKAFTEEVVPFEVVWSLDTDEYIFTNPDEEPGDTEDIDNSIESIIFQAQWGFVQIEREKCVLTSEVFWEQFGDLIRSRCGDCDNNWIQHVRVRYYYKTNPVYLSEVLLNQIPMIRTAMYHKTGADLPTLDCGCTFQDGNFIYEQQKIYSDIAVNPFTGIEVTKVDRAKRIGQMIYDASLSRLQKFHRPIRL